MKQIIQGVKNAITNQREELANKRMSICKKCEYLKESDIFGYRCDSCGCILKYKVRSDSSCPEGKWDE